MVRARSGDVLGEIAADLRQALARRAESGAPGETVSTRVAAGMHWSVDDVICTSGPADRSFEEQHNGVSIAAVVAGTFQYRTSNVSEMMTSGSLLLGNAGRYFECGHEHAAGDRCVAFFYAPEFFEEIAADAGVSRGQRTFSVPKLPPLRELSPLVARAMAGTVLAVDVSWEEMSVEIAAAAIRLCAGETRTPAAAPASVIARITESVRRIEREPAARWTLAQLAADARHSPFHYLRIFRQQTGVTPHQFILRERLRASALQLLAGDARIIDVALSAGFDDISNFNAAFRREFGRTPSGYRERIVRGKKD
jgi:AraC family transcriptional regulator